MGPEELSPDISPLCPLQNPRASDLRLHRTNYYRSASPREQAGFRLGKSTVDQVTLMTQDVEDCFEAKNKAGAVFLDLTAAYDTVWHGITCKLLRLLPDRHMVCMIMELIYNRSFTLTTSSGQRSRLRRLKNGVPQGSVLAPSSSISTPTTCRTRSPQSTLMRTTWRSYTQQGSGKH